MKITTENGVRPALSDRRLARVPLASGDPRTIQRAFARAELWREDIIMDASDPSKFLSVDGRGEFINRTYSRLFQSPIGRFKNSFTPLASIRFKMNPWGEYIPSDFMFFGDSAAIQESFRAKPNTNDPEMNAYIKNIYKKYGIHEHVHFGISFDYKNGNVHTWTRSDVRIKDYWAGVVYCDGIINGIVLEALDMGEEIKTKHIVQLREDFFKKVLTHPELVPPAAVVSGGSYEYSKANGGTWILKTTDGRVFGAPAVIDQDMFLDDIDIHPAIRKNPALPIKDWPKDSEGKTIDVDEWRFQGPITLLTDRGFIVKITEAA